jgi:predicted enzyme related to lactoylglutathione lyase
MLPPGVAPHWLPYIHVDDADAVVARARKNGGTIMMGPDDVPDIGRFAVIQDPTGGVLAVMKPAPMMSKP